MKMNQQRRKKKKVQLEESREIVQKKILKTNRYILLIFSWIFVYKKKAVFLTFELLYCWSLFQTGKAKGVEGLIEIENPNRIVKKEKKISKLGMGEPAEGEAAAAVPKPELSRREREELEKQRAKAHYQKLHAEGKTEQARADLARYVLRNIFLDLFS